LYFDTGRGTCQHLTRQHSNTTLVSEIRGTIADAHMHPAQEGAAHLRLGGSMPAPMDAILLPDRSSSLQAPTQPSSGALSPMQQAQEHGKGSREARRQHTSPYGCHLVVIQKQVPQAQRQYVCPNGCYFVALQVEVPVSTPHIHLSGGLMPECSKRRKHGRASRQTRR
jgi:hypothetical protein